MAEPTAARHRGGNESQERMDIHLHLHLPDAVLAAVPQLLSVLADVKRELLKLIRKVETMAGELDTLTTEVSEATTVMDSAVTLLTGLAQALRDAIAANDPAKLQALAASLDSKSNELAQAVVDNTPAAPGGGGGTPPDPGADPAASARKRR